MKLKSEIQTKNYYKKIIDKKARLKAEEIKSFPNCSEDEFNNRISKFIISGLENCTKDNEIISDLIDRGLTKEKANEYLLKIDSHIEEKLKDAKTKVTLGKFILVIFLFLLYCHLLMLMQMEERFIF